MKWIVSILAAFMVLWGVSFCLGAHPSWRVNDRETGFQHPADGCSVTFFTEGCGVSHYGRIGLNPAVSGSATVKRPFFLLHGDSFIEALHVNDRDKPDAVLTAALSGNAFAYGTGRSGFGFPSMVVRAMEYERVLGKPVAHLFFCAGGIRNDVFEDGGVEFRKVPHGFAKQVVPVSPGKQKYYWFVNQLHLNFLIDAYNLTFGKIASGRTFSKRECRRTDNQDALPKELDFIMAAMANQLKAPSVIVYCPNLPRVEKGFVLRDNVESDEARVLREAAAAHGIYLIDVSQALLDLYDQDAIVARGFPNLGGPGVGHLNEEGIKAVFGFAAGKLRERYGL